MLRDIRTLNNLFETSCLICYASSAMKPILSIFLTGILSFSILLAQSQPKEKEIKSTPNKEEAIEKKDKPGLISRGLTAIFGKHGGDKLFYMPLKDIPYTPERYGYQFENVNFTSKDGTKLHGWFIPSKLGTQKAKATIVYSHGTYGSLAYHFGFVDWLIDAGYNVWMFDYRGYGKSEGKTSKRGIIEDTVAALKYIKTRKDIAQDKLISFGHSLGGAKSIAALAEYAPKGLKGVVVMGSFASYRDMASKIGGNIGKHLVSDTYNPEKLVKKLPNVPLLVIHGQQDRIVPFSHGKRIFENANKPKSILDPERGDHNNILFQNKNAIAKQLTAWIAKALTIK